MLQIDVWDEIPEDELEVGMYVGVYLWDRQYGNGPVVGKGEVISIDDKFVKVRHNNNSVSAYELGYVKFFELV